jgi:hypothetical protein
MIHSPMTQRLLHCILLLSVLFNTVVGMPLHASTHLHAGDYASAHGAELADQATSAVADESAVEHAGEAHAACVWCFTLGQLGGALTCAFAIAVPVNNAHNVAFPTSVVFVTNPGHWRFASRDPPLVLMFL